MVSRPYKPTAADLDLLTPDLRVKVEEGDLVMGHPKTWMFPDRPVLRDPMSKGLVKGSGKIAGSKIAADASRETAWSRRGGYRRALEMLVTEFEGSPDRDKAVTSLEEIMQSAWRAANEQGNVKEMLHIVELMAGKAKETSEVNVTASHLHAVLNATVPANEVTLQAVDVTMIEARRKKFTEGED